MPDIQTEFASKCDGCPYIVVAHRESTIYKDDVPWYTTVLITCDKSGLCDRLEKYLKNKMGVE